MGDESSPPPDAPATSTPEEVAAAYATVAAAYADDLVDELDRKPFDRWFLERLVFLADGGPILDAGCGPGHVTAHLAAAGADVAGIDLTPAMVDEARRRFPDLAFAVGDLADLPRPATGPAGQAWGVALAWYSLVHHAPGDLAPAVARLAQAVRPGGWVAVGLHVGPELVHLDEWRGHAVDITFVFHDAAAVIDAFPAAGLVDVEWYHRGPYAEAGETTERLNVLGRRP